MFLLLLLPQPTKPTPQPFSYETKNNSFVVTLDACYFLSKLCPSSRCIRGGNLQKKQKEILRLFFSWSRSCFLFFLIESVFSIFFFLKSFFYKFPPQLAPCVQKEIDLYSSGFDIGSSLVDYACPLFSCPLVLMMQD